MVKVSPQGGIPRTGSAESTAREQDLIVLTDPLDDRFDILRSRGRIAAGFLMWRRESIPRIHPKSALYDPTGFGGRGVPRIKSRNSGAAKIGFAGAKLIAGRNLRESAAARK